MKLDLNQTNAPTNKVQLKFYDSKNNQLNGSEICKNVEIPIIFPIFTSEDLNLTKAKSIQEQGYDVFNNANDFFNNPCTPFVNEDGVDVTLNSRRADMSKNVTFCQEGCTYEGMNITTETALCKCKTSANLTLDDLVNDFTRDLFSFNFIIITCYNLVFDSKLIMKNKGFWIMLSFIGIETILLIYIALKGFGDFILWLNLPKCHPPKKIKVNSEIEVDNTNKSRQLKTQIIYTPQSNKKIVKNNYINNTLSQTVTQSITFPYLIIDKTNANMNMIYFAIYQNHIDSSMPVQNPFIIIYSYIKQNHPIFNTFIFPDRLDFRILNVLLFFNAIAIDFSLNALFYSDNYIEQRYADKGVFNFLLSLPKSVFSSLVGMVLSIILSIFTSPSKDVKTFINKQLLIKETPQLTQQDNEQQALDTNKEVSGPLTIKINQNCKTSTFGINPTTNPKTNEHSTQQPKKILTYEEEVVQIIKRAKIKVTIFTVINYILMIFFLYYVSCFCAVNNNSQNDWLIGCSISFGIAMCIPFGFSIIFGLIKWIALKCKCQTLYIINELISSLL